MTILLPVAERDLAAAMKEHFVQMRSWCWVIQMDLASSQGSLKDRRGRQEGQRDVKMETEVGVIRSLEGVQAKDPEIF